LVENTNIDKEITDFLQNEKKIYKRTQREKTPYLLENHSRKNKGKEKEPNRARETNKLREEWKQTNRKEFRIAYHNVNRLKTRR